MLGSKALKVKGLANGRGWTPLVTSPYLSTNYLTDFGLPEGDYPGIPQE